MNTLIEHTTYDGHTYDMTHLVESFTWSGSEDEAARKVELTYAYNPKDLGFYNHQIELGDKVSITVDEHKIFEGRVFFRKRDTNAFTMSITAYDPMIYLAKSKVYLVFNQVKAIDAFRRISAEVEIPFTALPNLGTVVNFVADGKSCTEVMKMLYDNIKADTKKEYMAVYLLDGIHLVEKGTLIDGFIASDSYNVINSSHSESIEDIVNRVKTVNESGNVISTDSDAESIKRYGIFQDIYKQQPKPKGNAVSNASMAKAKPKGVKNDSSISAIGNIQCISGYSINVEEEQLKGKFYIKSDTHKFQGNVHTMDLTLEYMEEQGGGDTHGKQKQ